jgi:hypothetical protein
MKNDNEKMAYKNEKEGNMKTTRKTILLAGASVGNSIRHLNIQPGDC